MPQAGPGGSALSPAPHPGGTDPSQLRTGPVTRPLRPCAGVEARCRTPHPGLLEDVGSSRHCQNLPERPGAERWRGPAAAPRGGGRVVPDAAAAGVSSASHVLLREQETGTLAGARPVAAVTGCGTLPGLNPPGFALSLPRSELSNKRAGGCDPPGGSGGTPLRRLLRLPQALLRLALWERLPAASTTRQLLALTFPPPL